MQGSEILEVLHDCPEVKNYLFSLYECHYGEFFQNLALVEQKLKRDRYLFSHYAFYIREMKVSDLLTSINPPDHGRIDGHYFHTWCPFVRHKNINANVEAGKQNNGRHA